MLRSVQLSGEHPVEAISNFCEVHWYNQVNMERDFAPLSQACVRALNDKMYEKRKAAALEIEK